MKIRNINNIMEKWRIKSNPLYCEGRRLSNIKHAPLRMKCSKLNADLFVLNVVNSPECIYGHDVEDSEHFLFECPLYYVQMEEKMRKLNNINTEYTEIETLLL